MESDSSGDCGGMEEGLDVPTGLENNGTQGVDDRGSLTSSECGDNRSSDETSSGDELLRSGQTLKKRHPGQETLHPGQETLHPGQETPNPGLEVAVEAPGEFDSVGGSTSSEHRDLPVSGVNAVQLVKNFVEEGKGQTYVKTVDRLVDTGTISREVHVHLSQTNVHNPGAISLGGTVVVNSAVQEEQTPEDIPAQLTKLQKLREETNRRVQKWTDGMIRTAGTQAVLEKISSGSSWVTIIGSPGEGKTTTGYLALKTLYDMGRQVFDITRPEDYFTAKEAKKPVLMFNDVFGSSVYDLDKRWKEVLTDIVSIKEHTRAEEAKDFEKHNQMTVVMISRTSVLKEASSRLGRVKDYILGEKCLVDLTNGVKSVAEDRKKIWNYHAAKHGIQVDEKTVKEICDGSLSLPHGFPHCCSLFASMFAKSGKCDMKTFFHNPLEFLNQSMHELMADRESGPLLRDILKKEGSICLDDIPDDEQRYQYWSTLEKLEGTYLSEDDGLIQFIHPSMYDSAAFVVCQKDPLFVIRKCSLSFLNERVMVDGLHYGNKMESMSRIVTVNKRYETHLLERCLMEFKNRNISEVLVQGVFHDESFANKVFKRVLGQIDEAGTNLSEDQKVHLLLSSRDRTSNKTFIYLSTKSKSELLLRNICEHVELTSKELSDAVFGVCEHVSIPSMELLSRRYHLDMEIENLNLETPLLLAASRSSDVLIKLILRGNVNIHKTDKSDNSVLHKLCRYGGNSDVVTEILRKGVAADKGCWEYPYLPLNIACYEGHIDVVKSLLDYGVEMNRTNINGSLPLHDASWMGRTDIVRLLLDRGAGVNNVDREGTTFLHNASRRGHSEIVIELLKRGADVNLSNRKGVTPLHDASYNGHADIVKILLDNGAVIDKENSEEYHGKTPLHDACSQGHMGVIDLLLDRGASVNHANNVGDTPLHEATRTGNTSLIEVLLDKSADINCSNSNGVSPLHEASWNGHIKAAEILIGRGADLNAKNSAKCLNRTPLQDACLQGHTDIVEILVDRGVDSHATDAEGRTAVDIARAYRRYKTVSFLESMK